MAAPFYKYKDYLERRGTAFFSSNYALYGDISNRVMDVLSSFTPTLEQYSIDEAFLDLSGIKGALNPDWAGEIVAKVKSWIGIDVSVGIAPSKTLAKIANHYAKKNCADSSCVLIAENEINRILAKLKVDEIWGISKNLKRRLNRYSIWSALDLKNADFYFLRKNLGIMVERTARELAGQKCYELEPENQRKNIQVSRSFGCVTSKKMDLQEAAAAFSAIAAQKLRKQNLLASGVYLYIRTSKHAQGEYYSAGQATGFVVPTNSTFDILAEVNKLLDKIYRQECLYQKVGVILLDLVAEEKHRQQDMFGITEEIDDKKGLFRVIDKINNEFGRGSIMLGSEGIKGKGWKLKSEFISPRYTTNWQELPLVK